jgi:branched-chain amino acid transport system permease protein
MLALGFSLLYGVTKVTNLAYGAYFMIGCYIFIAFASFGSFLGLGLIPATLLSVFLTGLIGIITYSLFIRPIKEEGSLLVITVAVALIVERTMMLIFGVAPVPLPSLLLGFQEIFDVRVTNAGVIAVTASPVLFVILYVFIKKSKIGLAMRALAQNYELSTLIGINPTLIFNFTSAVSAGLAATAGILLTGWATGVASPTMWMDPLWTSFSIVVVGGIGRIEGTLVGSFMIGYAENAVTFLMPEATYLKRTVSLVIMTLILLFRRRGIFGKATEGV